MQVALEIHALMHMALFARQRGVTVMAYSLGPTPQSNSPSA